MVAAETTAREASAATTPTMVIFRAKNKNTYNRKEEQLGAYPISYRIDIRNSATKTLCRLVRYTDASISFEIIRLDEITKPVFFIEESKRKGKVKEEGHQLVITSA
jgi:hypothetical protein